MDLISIIIPVYNVELYVNKCIKSLVKQTYRNLEIILVNDGSTDKSGDICNDWVEYDSRIKVFHKENGGVSSARNLGLKKANGKYIMFVDPDDYCDILYVNKMYNTMKEYNSDITICSYFLDYGDNIKKNIYPVVSGLYSREEIFGMLFFGRKKNRNGSMVTALWLGMFKKEIIDNAHIEFDKYIRHEEDWLFFAEYFKYVKKVSIINEPLYYYFQRNDSVMHKYIKPSELSVKNTLYKLDKFRNIMNESNIDDNIYKEGVNGRYIGFVKDISKLLFNDKNEDKIKVKYDFLMYAIEKLDIESKLHINEKMGKVNKFWIWIIKHKCIKILSVYGYIYNRLKKIKVYLKL